MEHGTGVFLGLFGFMIAVYWLWPEDPRIGVVRVYYNNPRAESEPRLNQNPALPAYRAALNQEGGK